MSLTLTEVGSIRDIDPAEWDTLAADGGLSVAHAYLAGVEADEAVTPRYLVARDPDGRLAGALPWYTWCGGGDNLQYYSPHAVLTPRPLQQGTDAGDWLPLRLIGTRSAYWNEFLVHPARRGIAERRDVIAALLDAVLRPDDLEPAARALMYLTPAAAAEALVLLPPEMPVLLTATDTCLEVSWDDFDGYLAHLPATRRRSARLEMARFAAAGFEVTTCRLRDCWEVAGPLLGSLQRRHEVPMTDAQATEHLRAQVAPLDDRSLVFLCSIRGRPVGFSLFYRWGRRLFARAAGFDYAATEGSAAYFNLAFYLPIRRAIEECAESIWWGPASWEAKLLRGARLVPRWSAVAPPPALETRWRPATATWNQGHRRWWSEHAGRLGSRLVPDEWNLER